MSDKNPSFQLVPANDFSILSASERLAVLRILVWFIAQTGTADDDSERVVRVAHRLGLTADDIQKAQLEAEQAYTAREVIRGLGAEIDHSGLLTALVGLSLLDGMYDARQRTALRRLERVLSVPTDTLRQLEHRVLEWNSSEETGRLRLPGNPTAEDGREGQSNNTKWIVAGAVAGGALLAATGFAAAPAIGGIVGTKALGLSGAAATSAGTAFFGGGSLATGGLGVAGGKAAIAGLFGATGAAVGAKKAARRTGGLDQFELESLETGGSRVVLGVSGFLSENTDFDEHWSELRQFHDGQTIDALRWESESLRSLGTVIGKATATLASGPGGATIAAGASRAAANTVALPATALAALNIIDNPWSVARDRAEKAGRALADLLRNRRWGHRPVTLVGFSLGARVLVHALAELESREIARRIERVYLLGGAVAADCPEIDHLRHAVSGPVVNGYCTTDRVLAYLYRAAEWETPIGLTSLDRDHILDVNLSDIVDGHLDYNGKLSEVLQKVTSTSRNQDPERW